MASSNRLISQFKPDSYQLDLFLNKKEKVFHGNLTINGVRRTRPSYRISLNQSNLKISSVKIYQVDKGQKTELGVTRIVHHAKLQEVRLHTERQIVSGKYQVELEYSGKVTTKGTNGFYTSTWLDDNFDKQEILATQFETHYARQLLPCIDEPEAKATFNLKLHLEDADGDNVLFNTEIESQESAKGVRIIKFFQTPVMSTYLLALIMGDLKSTSNQLGETQLNVYSTSNKVKTTEFALDFASRGLKLLEDKFATPYPLNKLDLVAVPDFDAGGMENWGLITFREDLLLFDEGNSTLADKQMISLIIAHELAHQWFGNLVTMKWWDELWLNEGFANFIEYYLVDQIYPEWKMFEQYLITEKSSAVRLDSLPSSRPVVNNVKTAHQAVEAFDAIAYEKSGSVIRMIFNLLGEKDFMLGLHYYFKKYSYKSATSVDLLACWQKYTKIKLPEFTRTWLYKSGLPKVEVSIGKNPQQIILKQSRFLSEPNLKVNISKIQQELLKVKPSLKNKQKEFYANEVSNRLRKPYETTWQIPINFVTENKSTNLPAFVMTKPIHTIQLAKDGQMPVKLNQSGESFYITSYPLEFLAPIAKALQVGKLAEADLLNILSDIISLNRARQFKPGAGAILDLMLSSRESARDAQFWSLAGGFIGYLHYHLKQTDQAILLNPYIYSLTKAKLKKIGFEATIDDSAGLIATRFELLSLATLAREKECTDKLNMLFEQASGDIELLESEKRLLVLYSVAKRGKKQDYQFILNVYKEKMGDSSLRDDLTYSLCMFEDEDLVKNNLQIMQDPELVRDQDILAWLSQLLSCSKNGQVIVLKWVLKDGGWQWLNDNLSPFDTSSAVKIIMSSAFNTKDLNILRKFFDGLGNVEIEKSIKESLDIAKSRISWHKIELPKAIEYLSDYSGKD